VVFARSAKKRCDMNIQRFLKLILILLFPVSFVVCALQGLGKEAEGPSVIEERITPTEAIQIGTSSAKIVIDFGEGRISTYSDVPGKTAFEALQKIASSSNILLETKQYDFGIFVKGVDGLENTKDFSWTYFVNGRAPEVASDKYDLREGDRVEWRYIKSDY